MKVNDCELPDDLLYDKDYGWVKVDNDVALLGVTEFGVKQAKEIAFIELPQVADEFRRGQEYAVLEASKWAGSLKAPLSGEVLEVNEKLIDAPTSLSKDPYNSWLVKIKLENPEEVDGLMDVKEAGEFYKGKDW